MYQIYLLTCRLSGKQYVGLTRKTAEQRLAVHVKTARSGASISRYALYRAFRKHGPESFDLTVLHAAVMSYKQAQILERAEIEQRGTCGRGYNMTKGGEGSFGYVWSPEMRRQRSEAYSGGKHPMVGIKRPDTSARLLRDNPMKRPSVAKASGDRQRGVPKRPEANEKISNKLKSLWAAGAVRGRTGLAHTVESREKMSASLRGKGRDAKRGDRNPAKRADVRAKMSASAKKRTMRAALARAGGCLSFLNPGKFEMHGVRSNAIVPAPFPAQTPSNGG